MRVIHSDACVAEGIAWLVEREPRFTRVTAPVALRRGPDGFGALMSVIVGQQVSTASAAAISARLSASGIIDGPTVAGAGAEGLAACGLSRPKIRYLLALADAAPDFAALRVLDDDALVAAMMAHKGVGRWTAEIYGIFALGRPDILPAGDLALRIAAGHLFDLPDRPDEHMLRAMAQDWSPWRAVAARLLFTYYRSITTREGVR